MTDTTEPTVMVSRQRHLPAVNAPTASADDGRLSVELRYAESIAKAGRDMLPESYRNQPGAVLLVNQWAQKHEVDILTAMQTVAFIHGRPVIDATMQRALAERAGYRVKVLDGECDDTAAKVEVWLDGERLGSATYTIEHARQAGLANKSNWKQNPGDMLVARATTRAIRRHAPSVLIGLAVGDEAEQADPLAVMTAETPDQPDEVAPVEADPPDDIVDAEVVEDAEPLSVETLRVRLKSLDISTADAIRKAQELASELGVDRPGSLATMVEAPGVLAAVVAWLDEQEQPF